MSELVRSFFELRVAIVYIRGQHSLSVRMRGGDIKPISHDTLIKAEIEVSVVPLPDLFLFVTKRSAEFCNADLWILRDRFRTVQKAMRKRLNRILVEQSDWELHAPFHAANLALHPYVQVCLHTHAFDINLGTFNAVHLVASISHILITKQVLN